MSAAVTAFYDVRDVILQNQKNRLVDCNRTLDDLPADTKLEIAAAMMSKLQKSHQLQLLQFRGSPVIGNRDLMLSGRRLDRSISEPVGCDPKRVMSSQQQQNIQNMQSQQRNVNSSRYKTELCRPFEENGYCKYGDKCQFAHGTHELRSLARHPKYKTELCRTFHTIGFCPYGPRCHFIHNEDERRLSQINQLKQPTPPVSATHPQRPRALNFSLVRDSLGSTADSPPSSVTSDSPPSMSPTWLNEDIMAPHLRYSPPATAPVSSANIPAFTFPADPAMAPLNVDTLASLSSLSANLSAMSLNNSSSSTSSASSTSSEGFPEGFPPGFPVSMREPLGDVFCPPSPPDSLGSESPLLDLSRGLRLPIFSQISTE